MLHLKIIRNLKTVVWLFFVALIPLTLLGLYWANQTGLPSTWRTAIEQEISKRGIHIEIGSLRYIPLKGFVASKVRVYAEEERVNEISKLERVQLVLDYASLANGKFRLRKIELRNAELSIAVDPNNPAGDALAFTEIYGTILIPNQKSIEIRNTRGKVGGIDVTMNARFQTKNQSNGRKNDFKNNGKRREMIAVILRELNRWKFDPEGTPKVQIDMEGHISKKETLKGQFYVQAASIEKNDYRISNITANGNLSLNLITLTSFSATDSRGTLTGNADYLVTNEEGRFNLESSIDITRMLGAWFSTPFQIDVLSGGTQKLSFNGDFDLSNPKKPDINLTGKAMCESIMFRGVSFDTLETWFSYQEGRLFFRDAKLTRPDGYAVGKMFKEGNLFRLKVESTLPVTLYKPFFKGKPLEKIIGDFTENSKASCELSIEGSFDTKNKFAWAYTGSGKITNVAYRGVPFHSATCSFALNTNELDFYDGKVDFDYTNYELRKRFEGPTSGKASIQRIRYDSKAKLVLIEKVSGVFWAAPLVRMFAPKVADNIETYRFHRPHTISGSGQVDVTPQGRTDLTVNFSTKNKADYKFLGKDLTLTKPSATVHIRNKEVDVTNLTSDVVGGKIQGKFSNKSGSKLSGELSWTKLDVLELSNAYELNMKTGGNLTGRIEFGITGGDISTMSGEGLIAMEDGELFSVPIFGPLSTVASKVVNDKRLGHERAKYAFCNFTIQQGIAQIRDFETATTSVKFTGDGSIDISAQTIDFTIRLNARGLLSLVTIPLRPFYGLFQFRGTGPLKKPVWENVHFTSPPDKEKEILLSPPKAKAVD
ncbi:MAG: AsmA-like C-terminal region-containing protein [Verrucomicrobiota bacterium]